MNNVLSAAPAPKQDSLLKSTVLPVGSFLVGLIGLFSTKDLPAWALVVLVTFVGVATIVLAIPMIVWARTKWRNARRSRRIAKSYFPRVVLVSQKLSDQLSGNLSDSLIYEMRNSLQSNAEISVRFTLDFDEFVRLREWLSYVQKKGDKNSTNDFSELLSGIDLAMNHYNQICKRMEIRVSQLVTTVGLSADSASKVRRAWNHGKDSQVRIIQEWANLGAEINHQYDDRVCIAYFPPLQILE